MKLVESLVKKFTKTASDEVVETVKGEVKNAALVALPIAIGVGIVLVGLRVFRTSTGARLPSAGSLFPAAALSTTSIVTNNFFFDQAIRDEMVARAIGGMKGGM